MFEIIGKRPAALRVTILGIGLGFAIVSSSSAPVSAGGPFLREVFDGPFAMALEQSRDQFIYLSVSEGSALGTSEPVLFYSVANVAFNPPNAPTTTVVEEGYGPIPKTSFQVGPGTVPQWVVLHTDTSAAANPAFTRSVGSGGLVSGTWQRTGFSQGLAHSVGQSRFANLRFEFKGQSSYASANATGIVVGHTLASAFGQIGTNSQNSITIEREP